MPQRIAIFVDYQNVYKRARETFGLEYGHHVHGQIDPARLGACLIQRRGNPANQQYVGTRVYRGLPSPKHDQRGYSACQRQLAAWEKQAGTSAFTRPLNYRDPSNPREKGIDVRIAVDMVLMAQRREYDVAILFSCDTDLVPALEAVLTILPAGSCEVAAWRNGSDDPRQLRVPGGKVWAHLLGPSEYAFVHDKRDYTAP